MSRTVTTPAAIPGPTVSGTVISGTGLSVTTLGIPTVGNNNPAIIQGPTAIMPAGTGAISPSTAPVPSSASTGPLGPGISPHGQSSLGMKPGSCHSPSPNVLQVVKQVSYRSRKIKIYVITLCIFA